MSTDEATTARSNRRKGSLVVIIILALLVTGMFLMARTGVVYKSTGVPVRIKPGTEPMLAFIMLGVMTFMAPYGRFDAGYYLQRRADSVRHDENEYLSDVPWTSVLWFGAALSAVFALACALWRVIDGRPETSGVWGGYLQHPLNWVALFMLVLATFTLAAAVLAFKEALAVADAHVVWSGAAWLLYVLGILAAALAYIPLKDAGPGAVLTGSVVVFLVAASAFWAGHRKLLRDIAAETQQVRQGREEFHQASDARAAGLTPTVSFEDGRSHLTTPQDAVPGPGTPAPVPDVPVDLVTAGLPRGEKLALLFTGGRAAAPEFFAVTGARLVHAVVPGPGGGTQPEVLADLVPAAVSGAQVAPGTPTSAAQLTVQLRDGGRLAMQVPREKAAAAQDFARRLTQLATGR